MVDLITTQELADLLGWNVHTIHERRYRDLSLPRSIIVDHEIRYRMDDVERWLEDRRSSATTTTGTDHETQIT